MRDKSPSACPPLPYHLWVAGATQFTWDDNRWRWWDIKAVAVAQRHLWTATASTTATRTLIPRKKERKKERGWNINETHFIEQLENSDDGVLGVVDGHRHELVHPGGDSAQQYIQFRTAVIQLGRLVNPHCLKINRPFFVLFLRRRSMTNYPVANEPISDDLLIDCSRETNGIDVSWSN